MSKNAPKTLAELNLEDDFLFSKVMSDPEICRKVLEKILGISIRKVEIPIAQHTIQPQYDRKGIRLDVYVNDEQGTVYNVEMQRTRKRLLPKRSRYYQGSIDLDLIQAGEEYEKLRKSFVIFICTFDPFSEGRHIYTFENRCQENPELPLGDETFKIFLNTRGTVNDVDSELSEFLAYVENTTDTFAAQAESTLIKEMQTRVNAIKCNHNMEVEYMTLYQRDRENREEGREEGEVRMVALVNILLSENRLEDLKRITIDKEYRKELMEKYQI